MSAQNASSTSSMFVPLTVKPRAVAVDTKLLMTVWALKVIGLSSRNSHFHTVLLKVKGSPLKLRPSRAAVVTSGTVKFSGAPVSL